jgi:hypothetical protein
VVRYNPRIRFETLNLDALITRARAAAGRRRQARPAGRPPTALEAFPARCRLPMKLIPSMPCSMRGKYRLVALAVLAIRLVDEARTMAAGDVQRQAMRWLGLSEWICDRFGVGGGSAWNTIFLLRVARGDRCGCRGGIARRIPRAPAADGGAAIDALRPFHAPFAPAKGFVRWSSVAAFALEEHDAGRVRYNALQLANLLLEIRVVPDARTGRSAQAYAAMERLAAQIGTLRPSERGFFHAGIRAFRLNCAPRRPRPRAHSARRAPCEPGVIFTCAGTVSPPNREKPQCAQKTLGWTAGMAALAAVAALHGCGSDDNNGTGNAPATPPVTTGRRRHASANIQAAWVEIGDSNQAIARDHQLRRPPTPAPMACPLLTVDGKATRMTLRVAPPPCAAHHRQRAGRLEAVRASRCRCARPRCRPPRQRGQRHAALPLPKANRSASWCWPIPAAA